MAKTPKNKPQIDMVEITKERIHACKDYALANPKKASPAMSFLAEKEIDEMLKELIDNGVSFPQISKAIFQIFRKKISANSVKMYCVNKGFYKPKAHKTILILIDMQNGFLQGEYTKELMPKVESLLQKKIFDCVIATKFVNNSNSPFAKIMQWDGMTNPNEQEIPQSLKQYIDITIIKNTYDCVNKAFIEQLCKVNNNKKPKKVYLAGVDTDACVLTIATKLFDNGIRPIVLTQYCHSNGGLEYHKAGLLCLKRNIGAKQIIYAEISDKTELKDLK